MFGEIAKTFGRNFLVACFIPAGFWIAGNAALRLVLKRLIFWPVLESLNSGKGIVLLVCTCLLGLVIGVAQNPLIQVFEGYKSQYFRNGAIVMGLSAALLFHWPPPVPRAWIAAAAIAALCALVWAGHPIGKWWHRGRLRRAQGKTDLQAKYEFYRRFPKEPNILPTRLGNSIRAFESHAAVYNMEPISSWYRLVAVIPKDYQEQIGAAEANFQAVINTAAAGLALALETLGIYIWKQDWRWLTATAALTAASYVLYRFACSYAEAPWGEYVRSAFDLYRLDLLRQLGIKVSPPDLSLEAEGKLWYAVQQLMLFGKEDPKCPVRFAVERPVQAPGQTGPPGTAAS